MPIQALPTCGCKLPFQRLYMCGSGRQCLVVGTSEPYAGQVPVDDPLVGEGASAPDGDNALDDDADDTEEQSEKRKEAEASFKVGALAHSLAGQGWADLHGRDSGSTATCMHR